MYIFVRTTGIILMVFGILAMLVGIGMGLSNVMKNQVSLSQNGPPNSQEVQPQFRLPETSRPDLLSQVVSLFSGAVVFFQGLVVTALGQLMLVFVDIASNTEATNQLLLLLMQDRRVE